jgi:LysM repeat protein
MDMSQILIYLLLVCALVLPVAGALALRLLSNRLQLTQLYGAAGAILAVALVSLLLLARSDVPNLQIGGLSLLLPVAAPEDSDLPPIADLPTAMLPAETSAPAAAPTGTFAPAATSIPPTAAPTEPVAATIEPTTEPPTPTPEPPTATPEPSPAPTEPPAAPAGPRTYTVQSGDTLRSIAEQFNVSVQALIDANSLTAEQADSLRVGQELVIPS